MRINLLVTCIAIAAVVIITTFALTIGQKMQPGESAPSEAEPIEKKVEQAPKAQREFEYLLKEYEGRLAVFFHEEEAPQTVFDVYVSTLPEYDRGQLQQGVPVKDYGELLKRIEDYIS